MSEARFDCIILGAGFAGLSTAFHLSQKKLRCLVLDPSESLGGLVASYDLGGYKIEKFYHHLQRGDLATVKLMEQLAIQQHLQWLPASSGYLSGDKLYPLNTPIEIALFPDLSLQDKWRMAQLIKLAKQTTDLKSLDLVSVRSWIVANCGSRVYENFFAPLLRGKFGNEVESISAAWLVGRIRFRSHRSWSGETLGYVDGGFHLLVDALAKRVQRQSNVQLKSAVERVEQLSNGDFRVTCGEQQFIGRSVVTTMSPNILLKIIDWPENNRQQLERLRFQKTVCAVIALARPLTRVYWCNINNPDVSFAVLLEHTNFCKNAAYPPGLLYLANYCGDDQDPFWRLADEEILRRYHASLKAQFRLDRSEILWSKVARAHNSGLIYVQGTLENIPDLKSEISGLFITGMLRSFPERSINDAIQQGEQAASAVAAHLS